MIIKRDSTQHRILLALRAGAMSYIELSERFGGDNAIANSLAQLSHAKYVQGIREVIGMEYKITPAGLAACPPRRKPSVPAKEPSKIRPIPGLPAANEDESTALWILRIINAAPGISSSKILQHTGRRPSTYLKSYIARGDVQVQRGGGSGSRQSATYRMTPGVTPEAASERMRKARINNLKNARNVKQGRKPRTAAARESVKKTKTTDVVPTFVNNNVKKPIPDRPNLRLRTTDRGTIILFVISKNPVELNPTQSGHLITWCKLAGMLLHRWVDTE